MSGSGTLVLWTDCRIWPGVPEDSVLFWLAHVCYTPEKTRLRTSRSTFLTVLLVRSAPRKTTKNTSEALNVYFLNEAIIGWHNKLLTLLGHPWKVSRREAATETSQQRKQVASCHFTLLTAAAKKPVLKWTLTHHGNTVFTSLSIVHP